MKKFLLLFLILCSCVQSWSQSRENYSLLWRFKLPESNSYNYLFGTMHLNDDKVFDFSDSVLVCFDRCDGAAFEIDMDSLNFIVAEAIGAQMDLGDYIFDDETEVKSPPTEFTESSSTPLNTEKWDIRKEAKMRQTLISEDSKQKEFLDSYLHKRAVVKGKRVIGLEEADGYMRKMKKEESEEEETGQDMADDEYPLETDVSQKEEIAIDSAMKVHIDSLVKELNKTMDFKKLFLDKEDMLEIYWAGDLDSIEKVMKHPFLAHVSEDLNMIPRNYMHLNGIKKFSKDSTFFVSVGAGHLPGEEGVINLLRKEGYIVERVQPSFTGSSNYLKEEKLEIPWQQFVHDDGLMVYFPSKPAEVEFQGNGVLDMFISMDVGERISYFAGALKIKWNTSLSLKEAQANLKKSLANSEKLKGVIIKNTTLSNQAATEIIGKEADEYLKACYVFHENGYMYYLGVSARTKEKLSMPGVKRFFDSVEYTTPKEKLSPSWSECKPTASSIRVMAPPLLTERVIEAPRIDGTSQKIFLSMYMETSTGEVFMVRHSDCSPGEYYTESDQLFQSGVEIMLSQDDEVSFSVVSDTLVQLYGFPAKRTVLASAKEYMNILQFMRGYRHYIILSTRPLSQHAWDSPFFESIKLDNLKSPILKQTSPRFFNCTTTAMKKEQVSYTAMEASWGFDLPTDSIFVNWTLDEGSSIQKSLIRFELDTLYSCSNLDTLLLRAVNEIAASYEDSITSSKFGTEDGYRYVDYEGHYPKFKQTMKKGRVILNGRELLASMVVWPIEFNDSNIIDSLAYSIKPIKRYEYDLTQSRTKDIISWLEKQDADSLREYNFMSCLEQYSFEDADLPLLKEAFLKNYITDTLFWGQASTGYLELLQKMNAPGLAELMQQKIRTANSESMKALILGNYIEVDSSATGFQMFIELLNEVEFTESHNIISDALNYRLGMAREYFDQLVEVSKNPHLVSGFLSLCSSLQADSLGLLLLKKNASVFMDRMNLCLKNIEGDREDDLFDYWSNWNLSNACHVLGEFDDSPKLRELIKNLQQELENTGPLVSLVISELRLGYDVSADRKKKCLSDSYNGFEYVTLSKKYGIEKESGIDELSPSEILEVFLKYYMSDDYMISRTKLYRTMETERGQFYIFEYSWEEQKYKDHIALGPFAKGEPLPELDGKYIISAPYNSDQTDTQTELRNKLIKSIAESTYETWE
ncbi:MAG: TraB/GumN family protein [Flavobacteriales bacterium]|nr:TraB/GumN family protein [Flavobacteriales bacterium]